ncbi:MAG TPA: DNA-directed RNA polymerase subunit alpha [bacterium]|nr:DNA-directed RNA polymerase subunit alpha [bacterium]
MVEKKYVSQGIIKPEEIKKIESTPTYGKFVISPFERGYGITVGNSLRRVLLSSIVGAAVKTVRFEGIRHEFEVINGVVEDPSDIIQNIKKLAVNLIEGNSAVITINEKGNKTVTAGDIKCPANVKISNPELVIATLTGGTLNVEMEVNIGFGYIQAEDHTKEDLPIGVIPIDSIYTPIIKVKYEVEKTRVGQSTDYDKLILDIHTNGTISPEDALAYSAKILKDCYTIFINFEETEAEPAEPELTPEEQKLKEILQIPIDELELSVRSANCLREAKIKTIGELAVKSENEMLKTRNFGKKSLREIREKLSKYGLNLGMTNLTHLIEEQPK